MWILKIYNFYKYLAQNEHPNTLKIYFQNFFSFLIIWKFIIDINP